LITNGYCSLVEFQTRTGITDATLTEKTSLIEREVERNSRSIDRKTSKIFYPKTLTASKVVDGFGINADGLIFVGNRIYFPGIITSITEVVSDGTALTENEDYYLGLNFIEGEFTGEKTGVLITGVCGQLPDDINEICLAMTEVTTGLGTYTMIGEGGDKVEVTRDNMPDWVDTMLELHIDYSNYG